MYGVSRITVRRALDELCTDGYLVRAQGRGTFVREKTIENRLSKFYSFSEILREKGLQEKTRLLHFGVEAAGREAAEELGIAPSEKVFRIDRLRFAGNTPYALEQSFIPLVLAPGLSGEAVEQHGLYLTLNRFGIILNRAVEHLRAVSLNQKQAEILQCENGGAAMLLLRTTCAGQQPVEYCRGYVRGDFFRYTVELK